LSEEGQKKPWHRQSGETPTAYARFRDFYLIQDERRSVDQAYRLYYANRHGLDASSKQVKKKTSPGGWRQWSMGNKWDGTPVPGLLSWRERANAWNDHLARLQEKEWERRRSEVREADWSAGARLRKLAQRILDEGPNFLKIQRRVVKGEPKQVVQADGTTMMVRVDREIVTTALTADLAVKATKAASDLQREAAEVPKTPLRVADAEGQALIPMGDLIQALLLAKNTLREKDDGFSDDD